MAMTNAERQAKYKAKKRELSNREKAQAIEQQRKDIIRYVETLPGYEVTRLYELTIEQQKLYDNINNTLSDIDLDDFLKGIDLEESLKELAL